MALPESSLQDWACDRAAEAGWYHRKVKWAGRRNAPDNIFAKEGRVVFIEFKRTGETPRPGQEKEIKAMRDAGMEVYATDNPLRALDILGVSYATGQ